MRDDQEPAEPHAERRERLREPPAPELAGDRTCERHDDAIQEGGDQPQAEKRVAEGHASQPRGHHRHRGLIHVPERQMVRRGEEVQLVAVVSVARGEEQQQRDRAGRDPQHGASGERMEVGDCAPRRF